MAYKLARENLQATAVLQKHYYNRKAKGVKFAVGQSVDTPQEQVPLARDTEKLRGLRQNKCPWQEI